ncbi:MAG: hypothetical protein LBD01_03065 [Puniceicoccales bacterium]|jgi:hypothetical protein|nr:hypothetical protein [Puniceicoccales bacterium]
MKKLFSLSLFAVAGTVGMLLQGCGQAYDTAEYGPSAQVEPAHNLFFGIVKTSPNSYRPVSQVTIHTPSTDYGASRDFSGTEVSLFWGLITFTDYDY